MTAPKKPAAKKPAAKKPAAKKPAARKPEPVVVDEQLAPSIDDVSLGGGMDPGEAFDPVNVVEASPATSDVESSLMAKMLDGVGEPLTKAEIADKLQFATGMLHDAKGEQVMADLQMTKREAEMVASGLAAWSQRTPVVAQLFRPSPSMQFVIGWSQYGYRVWSQRQFNLQMLEMQAGVGAADLGTVGTFAVDRAAFADAAAQFHDAPEDDPPAGPAVSSYNPVGG